MLTTPPFRPLRILLARITLAAVIASIPGPQAWAAAARVRLVLGAVPPEAPILPVSAIVPEAPAAAVATAPFEQRESVAETLRAAAEISASFTKPSLSPSAAKSRSDRSFDLARSLSPSGGDGVLARSRRALLAPLAPSLVMGAGVIAAWALSHFGIAHSESLLPLAMMGSIMGVPAAKPRPGLGDFLKQLQDMVPEGSVIDWSQENRIAARLGLEKSRFNTLYNEAYDAGHLGGRATLPNQTDLHYSFRRRVDAFQGGDHAAQIENAGDKAALSAIRHLNTNDTLEHARGIAAAGFAIDHYDQVFAQTKHRPEQAQEAVILRSNLILEFFDDTLRERKAALEQSATAQSRERLPAIERVLDWLRGAYYSTAHTPAISPSILEDLLYSVDELAQNAEHPDYKNGLTAVIELLPQSHAGRTRLEPRPEVPESARAPEVAASFLPLAASEYPTLLQFGRDLTQLAAAGRFDPLIGRESELERVVQTLGRRKKSNPLLVGEPGVGKTAIVEGLARKIASGEIPSLTGKRVISITMSSLEAGAKFGDFEKRLGEIIAEAQKSAGRVILFIDEIHTLMSSGKTSEADSGGGANMLKPALADGSISVIGGTTYDELSFLEEDKANLRRFKKIDVPEPSPEDAEKILLGAKRPYEEKHDVAIGGDAVKAAVRLARRFLRDTHLPDSAFDLLDDAGSDIRRQIGAGIRQDKRMAPNDLAQEIARRTGIPVGEIGKSNRQRLRRLPQELNDRVIGQPEAMGKLAEAAQRAMLGYRHPDHPTVFLFAGKTGRGKTEAARVLAQALYFGDMTRIDMSEYKEPHTASRLIGAPPGYTGYGQEGKLTGPVRRKPYQLILLDEVDKAHPDIFDLLLQVLDHGELTDGKGRTIDFRNVFIVMTTNLGADVKDARQIGFVQESKNPQNQRLDAAKLFFRPELLGRIGMNNVITFQDFTERGLGRILDLRIVELNKVLADTHRMNVALTKAARKNILLKALPLVGEYGARPLEDAVFRDINGALTRADLEGRIKDGDKIIVDWDAQTGEFRVARAKRPAR